MSLILDALKRAERDRRADPAGAVDVPSLAPPARSRLWLRLVLGTLLALVVLLVVAVAVNVVKKRRAANPPVAATRAPAPAAQTHPATSAAIAPQQAPPETGNLVARPAPKPIPGTESVSSLDELSEPEPPPPSVSVSPAAPSQQAPAPQPKPAAAPDDDAGTAQPAPAEAPAVGDAPEREVPQALTQPAPLRKFREMPPEFRADFPPLNVQVHNYEKDVAARFVIVNDRRYKDGETMAEGPRIAEIVRDGMILEFRGEKLLYTLNR